MCSFHSLLIPRNHPIEEVLPITFSPSKCSSLCNNYNKSMARFSQGKKISDCPKNMVVGSQINTSLRSVDLQTS